VAVNPGRQGERHLLKANSMALEAGDVVEVRTGGGGGFGSALERDPDLVLRDVLDGYVTRNGANRDYGVVVGPDGSIDEEATRRVRSTWRATI
jgi:N-methylhydantoinase B